MDCNMKMYPKLCDILGEHNVLRNEPLKKHTTFRIGGGAYFFVNVTSIEKLIKLFEYIRNYRVEWYLIGNGSNLLVSDEGFDGIIIHLAGDFISIGEKEKVDTGYRFTAGAATMLSAVSSKACEYELTGMEFAHGIPGTLGGAIVMNAGAYGGEMCQIVKSVTVLDVTDNTVKTYVTEEMQFGYRQSRLKSCKDIVLSVEFLLQSGNAELIKSTMDNLDSQRREKQPLNYPSAGSTFKRPEGAFAGKLISDAGLKGYRIGDAKVSEKHAGFVINEGNATALEVKQLIGDVQAKVLELYDVMLEPEVIFL